MLQECIEIKEAGHISGSYSQILKLGDFLYLSGILPINEKNEIVSKDPETQIRRCFQNLRCMLGQCDMKTNHVMKMNVYLTDLKDLPLVDRIIAETCAKPYPARSVVGVKELIGGARIQIDGIAVDTRALEVICSEECGEDDDNCDGSSCCRI